MKVKFNLLLLCLGVFFSCQQSKPADSQKPEESPKAVESPKIKKGMIKVTILYPNGEGKTFDMNYYEHNHMPMVASMFGDALKFLSIDKGIASGRPNTPMPFLAIGHLYFETLSAYEKGLEPYVDSIRKDFPKYTNVQPVIQISEVLE
ncbi:EthD family reductase [Chitinophaga sp. G-6-1-13]|uniref:EthD family reductase n=1 Tax=Chitinophaga fulva TaxID=2728842 RepID=A0A848GT94_9BACT|nr:EthD family reductase [Chitinophaga fulva]NML39953.1 EthD family reductase [Chitinophaga fulva]